MDSEIGDVCKRYVSDLIIACVAGIRIGGRREVRARNASERAREAQSFGIVEVGGREKGEGSLS